MVSPFHLDSEPMRALALFNFERDPDLVYQGLEPQAFDDDRHGRGLLVIGWRVDGRVDVFHDPELRLDPATYAIAGSGLHRMESRDLSGGRFELGPGGLSVDLTFVDLEDRPIRLVARETDTRPRRPFALLAPMGTAATDPPALPLVYVKDLYFVRRAGSEVRIEIDGRVHRSDTLPLLLDNTWMHFVRYSATPLIALWNHRDHRTARVLTPSTGTTGADGTGYELVANGQFCEIHDIRVDGSFRVSTEPSAGTVDGTWQVTRRGHRIEIEAVPPAGGHPATSSPWPDSCSWSSPCSGHGRAPTAGTQPSNYPLPATTTMTRRHFARGGNASNEHVVRSRPSPNRRGLRCHTSAVELVGRLDGCPHSSSTPNRPG